MRSRCHRCMSLRRPISNGIAGSPALLARLIAIAKDPAPRKMAMVWQQFTRSVERPYLCAATHPAVPSLWTRGWPSRYDICMRTSVGLATGRGGLGCACGESIKIIRFKCCACSPVPTWRASQAIYRAVNFQFWPPTILQFLLAGSPGAFPLFLR